MGEFNVAPNTQVGRINIPEKVYENENAYNVEEIKYSRGGEFLENYVVDNHIEFMHRWFGLANIQEMVADIDEFYNGLKHSYGNYSDIYYSKSPIRPIIDYVEPEQEEIKKVSNPITFYDEFNRPEEYNIDNIKERWKNLIPPS